MEKEQTLLSNIWRKGSHSYLLNYLYSAVLLKW